MERQANMADGDEAERRVYVLPGDQLKGIRAYQAECGIASEVEAVRRLLNSALQMRDTVKDVMNKLQLRFIQDRDLRIMAKEILIGHIQIKSVEIEDNYLVFSMRNSERGKIDKDGKTWICTDGYDNWIEHYQPKQRIAAKQKGPSWDAPKGGGDLDDEIPF